MPCIAVLYAKTTAAGGRLCSPGTGEVKIRNPSRDAFRARVMPPPRRFASGTHDPEKWYPVFGSDHAREKGRRSAERRMPTIIRAFFGARQRAKIGARSSSGASPRHSPAQSQPPLAQLQNRVSSDKACREFCPVPPCPVKRAPRGPVLVPDERDPGAARERSVNPRAGTALAPPSGVPS